MLSNNMTAQKTPRGRQAESSPGRCPQCLKTFNRTAHLRRHQASSRCANTPHKSFVCEFCQNAFSRSDTLRAHYRQCTERGDRPMPPSLERGRKRHACNECSRLKVKCDEQIPCGKCKEFGRECVKSGAQSVGSPDSSPGSSVPADGDRNSINFLLNAPGETDFIQAFPKSSTMSPANVPMEVPSLSLNSRQFDVAISTPQNHSIQAPDAVFDRVMPRLLFQSTFEEQTREVTMDDSLSWTGSGDPQFDQQLENRAAQIRAALKHTIASQSVILGSWELSDAIDSISAASIIADVKLYFRHWHKHAPMVHEPSFNALTASLPLVLALMCLGGMYSSVRKPKLTLLLDLIETYIFNLPGISEEYDEQPYIRHGLDSREIWQQLQLEEIQGAYLFVVLQYWTGNPTARQRVRQQRFSRIVSIFHHLELTTAQHSELDIIRDEPSFRRWIRTESAIRLANIATMLDNTFGIFNNVAPRIQWAEIDLRFPSADSVFACSTYEEMRAKSLYPGERIALKHAFMLLFSQPSSKNYSRDFTELRKARLTALDMQVLIYYIYTHLWSATFNSPVLSLPGYSIETLTSSFKHALQNWKALWDEIRSAQSDWDSSGFQNSAANYYDAINAVINAFDRTCGRFPPIPSDCTKGAHLKILLKLG